MFPEGMDMNGLLAQAAAMQEQMQRAQQELAESSFTGQAGGGLVSATVQGTGELLNVEIKPEAVDVDDLESLSDMIVVAVRDAMEQANTKAAAIMPGLDGFDPMGELGF